VNASVTEAPPRPVTGADRAQEPAAVRIRTTLETGAAAVPVQEREITLELKGVSCYYGTFRVVRDVSVSVARREVTALIGPSGSGKTTVLRAINRMNDLVSTFRLEGTILLDGQDLYAEGVDAVELRRRVGMVFQKPNPFPKSIYDNVAYGPKLGGIRKKAELDSIVESSLRQAALWDEVKDRLKSSALGMSGGQQQRLCIARALAIEPDVILMDEPCSALDPISTGRIEDLMVELKDKYSIVIVTHNMQQAARVSDLTVFMTLGAESAGELVEVGATNQVFTTPSDRRTEDYITGRVG
jgi:phosphate transport system ATP-binding protein